MPGICRMSFPQGVTIGRPNQNPVAKAPEFTKRHHPEKGDTKLRVRGDAVLASQYADGTLTRWSCGMSI
jgi:hypothetical protein